MLILNYKYLNKKKFNEYNSKKHSHFMFHLKIKNIKI